MKLSDQPIEDFEPAGCNIINSLTLEHVFRVTLDVLHKLTGRAKYLKCQIFN